MSKTLDDYFADWESYTFGYGYGTGEEHTVPVLKTFFAAIGREENPKTYDYQFLEMAVGPVPAWLLINILCRANLIEYGTSPRYGWLDDKGVKLKQFIDGKSAQELINLTHRDHNYTYCYPDACNCGEEGYEEGRKCGNPFWKE